MYRYRTYLLALLFCLPLLLKAQTPNIIDVAPICVALDEVLEAVPADFTDIMGEEIGKGREAFYLSTIQLDDIEVGQIQIDFDAKTKDLSSRHKWRLTLFGTEDQDEARSFFMEMIDGLQDCSFGCSKYFSELPKSHNNREFKTWHPVNLPPTCDQELRNYVVELSLEHHPLRDLDAVDFADAYQVIIEVKYFGK